jgi:hypothetical protein
VAEFFDIGQSRTLAWAHRLEPDPVTAPVVSWMFALPTGRAQRWADRPRS